MERTTSHPLTPEEAKRRLREAAAATGPSAWVRRHPGDALLFALIGGLFMGAYPDASRRLADNLVRLAGWRPPLRRNR
jgi:hypothetical protein